MELRLQKYIASMQQLSDIRNLDPLNPTIFLMEHPVTATQYTTIAAITEPSHMGIPINTTWTVLNPTNPYYLKALKLKASPGQPVPDGIVPATGFTQTWVEIQTYDEIFSDPQYYDNSGSGIKGDKGDRGDPGPMGPPGPRGLDGVVDLPALVALLIPLLQPQPTLTIVGATSVRELTSSQYSVNLVIDGVVTPIVSQLVMTPSGAHATINNTNNLTVQQISVDEDVVLTATYVHNGNTLTATKTVTLQASTLVNLLITGVPTTMLEGQTCQAVAHAQFDVGADQIVQVVWSVAPPAAGSITQQGVFTAASVAADTPFIIYAGYAEGAVSLSAQADSTVLNIIATSIDVTGPTSIFETLTGQYAATVHLSNGTTTTTGITWSVSPGAAGAINSSGLLTTSQVPADTPATVTASATFGGVTVTGTVDLTVINLVPTGMTINGVTDLWETETSTLTATITTNNGQTATVTPTWSVVGSSGSINASGLFTGAVIAGSTPTIDVTVHATYTSGGATVTADHVITVKNVLPVSLTVQAASATITEGQTDQMTATAHYNDGTSGVVTAAWTRSPTAAGAINASGLFTAAQVAADTTVTITGSFSASGVTVTDSVDITVSDVPVVLTPYFGAAATNSVKNAALILSLAQRGPTADRLNNDMVIIDGVNISMFYAYPVSYGQATFTDLGNGFQGGWDGAAGAGDGSTLGPITVTVNGTPFYLYKTDQSNISPASNPTHWRVS